MINEEASIDEGAEEGDTELALGLIDREYARLCARDAEGQPAGQMIKYPIVNFLGGTIATDRVRHENTAEHGGLQHWRSNTCKQRVDDDSTAHIDKYGRLDYDIDVPGIAANQWASEQSTGMGLDVENLHSFITTGTHQKIIPIVANLSSKTVVAASEVKPSPQPMYSSAPGVHLRIASSTPKRPTAAIYKYRSKASMTYTALPALAVNQ